jgi:predicted ATPase with chaperone activity
VRESILEDIALKTLYLYGPFSVADLSEQIRLSYDAAEQLFNRLRAKLLCEVTGLTGTVPVIAISSQGRTRALELLSQNQYSGAMPVSLASYVAQVRKQSMRNVNVRPADVERAFAHLVFDSEVLSELGSALNSGNAIFLYGPPGAGKTASAEAMAMRLQRMMYRYLMPLKPAAKL